ncbi:hypothetical protein ACFOWM_07845 [Ferruginibacter yonginensis]|uniref:DUF4468 domain-containing protein n=1 Tax=Ferruginibacter yonginensis TaxID=1310416 RepID=A0ABV8QTS0_9BACT
MKYLIYALLLLSTSNNTFAQTKLIDAFKAINGKPLKGTLLDKNEVKFLLSYDENSKRIYAKTTGATYSNLNEPIYFINDYVATLGWVNYEEENGIITYNTKVVVADGNKIIIGRPINVKSKSSQTPYDIEWNGAISVDNIYAEEKIEQADKNKIAAACKPQVETALQHIVNTTKKELDALATNTNLVLAGKLRKAASSVSSYYTSLKPSAAMITSLNQQGDMAYAQKKAAWEKSFDEKIASGEFKSLAAFAKLLTKPGAAYEYVTVKVVYNSNTEKTSYTFGDKVLTPLKEANVTYKPEGSNNVVGLELIPVNDNHPTLPTGEVTLHFKGKLEDNDPVKNGYLLNKEDYETEEGIFYKGYYIIKQQGDFIEDSKRVESYYNFFALRPVGAAPLTIDKTEYDKIYSQYRTKEKLIKGEKVNF